MHTCMYVPAQQHIRVVMSACRGSACLLAAMAARGGSPRKSTVRVLLRRPTVSRCTIDARRHVAVAPWRAVKVLVCARNRVVLWHAVNVLVRVRITVGVWVGFCVCFVFARAI